jgi:hypothetical protein
MTKQNEPQDDAIALDCSTIRDAVEIVSTEMDLASGSYTVSHEQVRRWAGILRESLDEYTDSTWLQSIGFTEDESKNYRLRGWLRLTCDSGQWQAYSVKSSHWHFLCVVDLRSEVRSLISALKLNS